MIVARLGQNGQFDFHVVKMTFLRGLIGHLPRYTYSLRPSREYASKAAIKEVQPASETAISSCPANTLLPGLNYLKAKPVVLALPDEEYPPWLWKLLQPKVDVDAGTGSLAEKRRMKQERRANIKYSNLLKTQ